MSLESGNYIKDLQPLNPPGTDPVSEGNDHLKLIKKVLKNSFPSDIDQPQIPDIAGNDGKILSVKEDGSGTEWVDQYTPPAYPALTWAKLKPATARALPIETWVEMDMEYVVPHSGTYLVMAGVNKLGTGAFDLKETAFTIDVNGVSVYSGSHPYQYTSNKTASYNLLSGNEIVEVEEDDRITLTIFQDNQPNTTIMVGDAAYMNILRLA